ncbi:MAG: galactose-1-phosphate uridylyltransferase [Bythopirellula sp.]
MESECASIHRTLRSNSGSCASRGVALTRAPVFEQRSDPIVGRQVLIAENRAGRPNDFVAREEAHGNPSAHLDCPFCAGHENLTPEPLMEAVGADGLWQVRVVPNKFPAVALAEPGCSPSGPQAVDARAITPAGAHEVFVESPHHVRDITQLSAAELAICLRVYRDRLRYWANDNRIGHVSIFKNVGVRAGASLEHIHSQLVAFPHIPPLLTAELQSSQRYFSNHRRCIYCALIEEELAHGQRLVHVGEGFVAFCAFAARQPYETWIVPQHHAADYADLTDDQSEALARLLQRVVRAVQAELTPLSYNLILHTAPFRQPGEGDFNQYWHWHFELVPQSTQLAGFEWGTGMHINPLAPERAAARLRLA